jgi:intergrase/recombinase
MGVEPIYNSSAGVGINHQANGAYVTYAALDYKATRAGFLEYVQSKKYIARNARCMVQNLDRYVTKVSDARDIIHIFTPLTDGQRHNLIKAIRACLNYLQIVCNVNKVQLDNLRAAIPKDKTCIDLKIPEEEKIIADLRAFGGAEVKYRAIHSLLLDSGLRVVEAMYLVNNWTKPEKVGNFYRSEIGMFRGCKQAYYAYFTAATYDLLKRLSGNVSQIAYAKCIEHFNLTRSKYLRKFAFDKMVELEVPESVADFIEGRVPKRIGAKHYMLLRRQADKFYSKYKEYITTLRSTLAC